MHDLQTPSFTNFWDLKIWIADSHLFWRNSPPPGGTFAAASRHAWREEFGSLAQNSDPKQRLKQKLNPLIPQKKLENTKLEMVFSSVWRNCFYKTFQKNCLTLSTSQLNSWAIRLSTSYDTRMTPGSPARSRCAAWGMGLYQPPAMGCEAKILGSREDLRRSTRKNNPMINPVTPISNII